MYRDHVDLLSMNEVLSVDEVTAMTEVRIVVDVNSLHYYLMGLTDTGLRSLPASRRHRASPEPC